MRYFDRNTSFLIVLLCLPLIFLPKINLIGFGGKETAGIRLDDIILLILFGIVFWAHFSLRRRFDEIERSVFILVAFSLFSFTINRFLVAADLLHVHASLFYCVRLLEYFLFFYLGALSSLFFKAGTIIRAFFLWNLLIIILQKIGLVGQFSTHGYIPAAWDRSPGIASFPSEAGVLLNLAFCFLIYDEETTKKWISFLPRAAQKVAEKTAIYCLFLLCAFLIIMTGSRIAILALVVTFAFRLKQEMNWRSLKSYVAIFIFLGIACTAIPLLIMKTDAVFARSAGLLSFRNFELIGIVWERINLDHDPIGNESVKENAGYDMSWWMRIHKWCYALKIYYLHPECYLQGIGPGFAMAGLDGGFLRILTENGVIGCFLFWKVFAPIYRKMKQLKWMMISLMINMIFFDVYLAYKPMSLLFFVTGYAYSALKSEVHGVPALPTSSSRVAVRQRL
jgi:hypothetical protein